MAIRRGDLVGSVGALLLATLCGVADATMMTQTDPFDLTPSQVAFLVINDSSKNPPVITNTNNGPTSASNPPLNFNQFNPGLGSLTGVAISFTSTYSLGPSLKVAIASGSNTPLTDYFADGTLTLSLTGTGFIPLQSLSPNPTASATCTTDTSPCSSSPPPTTGNFSPPSTSGVSLSPFIGTGTFDLTAEISSALAPRISPDNGTSFSDNATMNGTLDSNWKGSVSVIYTFDAPATGVPEPLTLSLVVTGLVGIALLPRRRP